MKHQLIVQSEEAWDEENEKFIRPIADVINLEHSLYTISTWEEKHRKAFLQDREEGFTLEEFIDYIRIMSDKPIDDDLMILIVSNHQEEIESFLNDTSTATVFHTFSEDDSKKTLITSEMIYWQMFHYHIPIEFQHWHIQRLITLIRVCQEKEGDVKPQKMSLDYRRKLNESRKKKMKSKG